MDSGRLVVIMVVWCSVLGEYVTMRAQVSRKMVDAISEPTAAETEAMLAAVLWRPLAMRGRPTFARVWFLTADQEG